MLLGTVIRIATFAAVLVIVKKVYKMYQINKNNQKRQRKRANRDFSINQMKERCRDIKVWYACNIFCFPQNMQMK